MTDLPAELMTKLHTEALAEDAVRHPYCTGDRCADCEAPGPNDRHAEEGCCEATCGYCPRVDEHDHCRLAPGSEDGSQYCDQHGEGWLNDRSPDAERKYRILRDA